MISFFELGLLFLGGVAGGFLAGLLGIGGGIIYVLVFNEYLKYIGYDASGDTLVKLTIANSVFAVFFATLAGSIRQYQNRNFYLKEVLHLALPGALAAIITSWLLTNVHYSENFFSLLFIIVMLPLLISTLTGKENTSLHAAEEKMPPFILIGIGLISGIVTSLSGLGGGVVIVPLLSGVLSFPIKKTISISIGSIAIITFFLSAFYFTTDFFKAEVELPYSLGAVSFFMTLPVVLGVVIFSPVGVMVAKKLPHFTIRVIFVTVASLIISKMIYNILF